MYISERSEYGNGLLFSQDLININNFLYVPIFHNTREPSQSVCIVLFVRFQFLGKGLDTQFHIKTPWPSFVLSTIIHLWQLDIDVCAGLFLQVRSSKILIIPKNWMCFGGNMALLMAFVHYGWWSRHVYNMRNDYLTQSRHETIFSRTFLSFQHILTHSQRIVLYLLVKFWSKDFVIIGAISF